MRNNRKQIQFTAGIAAGVWGDISAGISPHLFNCKDQCAVSGRYIWSVESHHLLNSVFQDEQECKPCA